MPRPNPEVDSFTMGGGFYSGFPISWKTNYAETYRREYSSVNTPGFPKVKRENPYSCKVQAPVAHYATCDGAWAYISTIAGASASYFELYGGYLFPDNPYSQTPWVTPVSGVQSGMVDLAISDAASQAKNSAGNWALNVGEGHQLVELASTTMRRLAQGIKALRRGDLAGLARSFHQSRQYVPKGIGRRITKATQNKELDIQDLSNFWLEVQYGWKPLYADVYDFCDRTFAANRKPPTHTVVGRSRRRGTYRTSDDFSGYLTPINWEVVYDCEARCEVTYSVRSSAFDNLKALGLTNPVDLVWESIPFSFVADWFIPIGSYLDSLDGWVGLEFIRGSTSLKYSHNAKHGAVSLKGGQEYKRVWTNSLDPTQYIDGGWLYFTSSDFNGKYFTYDRSILSDFPYASPPSFKPLAKSLTLGHFENALALLVSAIR